MERIHDVATALLSLTYREMVDLGRALAEVADAGSFDVEDADHWAGLLAAWAENNTPTPDAKSA